MARFDWLNCDVHVLRNETGSHFKLMCKRPCPVGYLSRFIAFCVIYLFLSSIDKNLKEKKKVSKEKWKKKKEQKDVEVG